MMPHESGLSSHQSLSMAVMPERVCMRTANVAKLSPPSNSGTLMVAVFTLQSAAAASNPPSPMTSGFSSEIATMVLKS